MFIKLKPNLAIISDKLNYIVAELRGKDKNGEDKWVGIEFYCKIDHLFDRLVEEKYLMPADVKTFEEMLKHVEETKKELINLFTTICKQHSSEQSK